MDTPLNPSTISHLQNRVQEETGILDISVESVGLFLCGVNYRLAEKPFSPEFLQNVAYNGGRSFAAVIWLQLNYLMNGED